MRLILAIALLSSCGASQHRVECQEPKGYCFKADGVSEYRCYYTKGSCLEHESIISDQYPWAHIEDSCRLHKQ